MSGRNLLEKLRADLVALPRLSEPNWSEMEAWITRARVVFRTHYADHLGDLEKATKTPAWSYDIVVSGGDLYDRYDAVHRRGRNIRDVDDYAVADNHAENARMAEGVRKRALALVDMLLTMSEPHTSSVSSNIRVFISHAAADGIIAKELVDLVNNALIVPGDEAIRCTSVEGYDLPLGAQSVPVLRDDIFSCQAFIALLTPKSLASPFVLMELGAAWAYNKTALMCLAPWVSFGQLPGPFSQIHAVKWNSASKMAALIEAIATATGFEERNQRRVTASLEKFMQAVPMVDPGKP